MKAILTNWRYYVIVILFGVGFLAIGRAFGEPAPTMSGAEWYWQELMSVAVGFGCFYVLYRCLRHWEAKGEIPEFTNLKNE